jgi:hypothetical protein
VSLLHRFFDWIVTMIKGHGKPKPPVLTKVITTPSGDVDVIEGTPVTANAAGLDQYGKPFPITVTGWNSSNPAAITVSGTTTATLTYVAVGDSDIKPMVNGVLWA